MEDTPAALKEIIAAEYYVVKARRGQRGRYYLHAHHYVPREDVQS
jgi:hypothetical protein